MEKKKRLGKGLSALINTDIDDLDLKQESKTQFSGLLFSQGINIAINNSLPNYTLEKHALWQGGEVRNDNVYIILLRDVLSRWKSGYKSEFLANPSVIDSGLKHYLQNKMYMEKDDKNTCHMCIKFILITL